MSESTMQVADKQDMRYQVPESDQIRFSQYHENIKDTIKTICDTELGPTVNYDCAQIPTWVDAITSRTLTKLQQMDGNYKYIVSVIFLQRSNSGFHLFSTCYWDQTTDGSTTYKWENKSMHVIVAVFGCSLT
eukprot:GHVH01005671.1.p1 GENE.GHVH01005671.1~~GHVH01005671.1.p1  ORF type:complete len:132 (+),score=13.54 GHVH01005671.1:128-523(+)